MAITIDVLNLGQFGVEDAGASSVPLTTTASAAAGSTIILTGYFQGFDATGASDNGPGLTWTVNKNGTGTGSSHVWAISAYAPSGLPSGTVITVTAAGSAGDRFVTATSFLGIKTSAPLDVTSGGLGYTGTAWTTPSTTIQAGSVLIGACSDGNNSHTSTPTSPSIEMHEVSVASASTFTSCYRIEPSAGSYTVAGTWNNALASGATIGVAYLAAAASTLPLTNNFETGLADETAITALNSDDGSAGNAFTQVFTAGTGSMVFDTARAAHGTLSARLTCDAANNVNEFRWLAAAHGSVAGDEFGRLYIYRTGNPTVDHARIVQFWNAGETVELASINWMTTGKLRLWDSAFFTPHDSTNNIPLNEWVRIEWKLHKNATTGIVEAKFFHLDDVAPIETVTFTSAATGTECSSVHIGSTTSVATSGIFWLDDLNVNATGYPGPVVTNTAPTAPLSPSATAGDAQIALTWSVPASNGGSAITGYKIYRGLSSGSETLLASPAGTGTSYSDLTTTNGTTYYYKVSAVNAIGESALSSEVLATPSAPASSSQVRTMKRLYGPTLLGNAASTLYTCPASTTAVIRHIHVSNPTGAPVDFTLSIGASAQGTRIWDAQPIPADDVLDHYQEFTLTPPDIIQGFASAATTLNLTIDGYEIGAVASAPIFPSDTLFPSDTSP